MKPTLVSRAARRAALSLVALTLSALALDEAAARPYRCKAPKGRQWYECLGAVRGRAGLVASLAEPRSGRDAMALAIRLGFDEARPVAREALRRAIQRGRSWEIAAAAELVASLGDASAAAELADAVRKFENEGAMKALLRLSQKDAGAVAKEIAERVNVPVKGQDEHRLRLALPALVAADVKDALPLLRPLAGKTLHTHLSDSGRVEVIAALLRLGDKGAWKRFRRDLRRPGFPPDGSSFIPALGGSAFDRKHLLRCIEWGETTGVPAYDVIDRLAGEGSEGVQSALLAGLRKRTALREDRDRRDFSSLLLARHHGAMARLGEDASKKRLVALAEEDAAQEGSWVAARIALELGVDGAANAATTLFASASRQGASLRKEHARRELLDAAAARMGAADGRWVVAILDRSASVFERALHHFARLRPAGACDALVAVLGAADVRRAEEALVSLTILGDACRPAVEKLAADETLAPSVRGTALEVLAMMGAPFEKLAEPLAGERRVAHHLRRAKEIAALTPPVAEPSAK